MQALHVISGDRRRKARRTASAACAAAAVRAAMRAGFHVGRPVRIGSVDGRVIGYNIAAYGRYVGAAFPLLVATPLGIAKCRAEELRLT